MAAAALAESELGAFLRREGLHEEDLARLREEVHAAAVAGLDAQKLRGESEAKRRIKELERDLRRKDAALAETAALLVLRKKAAALWGGRGRRHMNEDRIEALALIEEAVQAGCRLGPACAELGLSVRTVQRWRCAPDGGEDRRRGPSTKPAHALSEAERDEVTRVANSPEHRNLSPKQIVPRLADRGVYIASESTFYRILRQRQLNRHRGASQPRRDPTRRGGRAGSERAVELGHHVPARCGEGHVLLPLPLR